MKLTRYCHYLQVVIQLDGADSSSDDDVDIDDDDDDDGDNEGLDGEGEEEPLNTDDDDEDEDATASMFEMENVVVCQYDKVWDLSTLVFLYCRQG